MTARDYLESKGLVRQDGQDLLVTWERSDGNRVRVVSSPLGYVLNTFGATIESALAAGTSIYAALMSASYEITAEVEGPDGQPTTITVQRTAMELGWAGHFGAWKAAGIIS